MIYTLNPTAYNFALAANITDKTQLWALHRLGEGLTKHGLLSKMKAVYPFIGGTAFTHKFNFVDPRDSDDAFRLSFYGGLTHSATGVLPDGASGYADTYCKPINMDQNSAHMSYYSRTNSTGTYTEMGIVNNSNTSFNNLYVNLGNYFYGRINLNAASVDSRVINSNSLGYYITSRISSTKVLLKKNNEISTINIVNSVPPLNSSNYLFAIKYDSHAFLFSNRECAFASIGDGLLDNDAYNLYLVVDEFNKILGRNV